MAYRRIMLAVIIASLSSTVNSSNSGSMNQVDEEEAEELCAMEELSKLFYSRLRMNCCPCMSTGAEANIKGVCCDCTDKNNKLKNLEDLLLAQDNGQDQCQNFKSLQKNSSCKKKMAGAKVMKKLTKAH